MQIKKILLNKNKIWNYVYSRFYYFRKNVYLCIDNLRRKIMNDRYVKFESQKKKADDCVIRALMKLTDRDWVTCYDELCELGRKKKRMPNEWKIIELWLKNHGYVKYSFGKLEKGQRRITVSEFANKNRYGTYLLNLRGHIVACINGLYYDSWDSGYCKVLTYYKLEQ